jgi:hypothetical protein
MAGRAAALMMDVIVDDRPADVVDAELKCSLISFEDSEPPARHATENSVAEWIRSSGGGTTSAGRDLHI